MDHTGEGRLWAEIHNLRRAVEAYPRLLADEIARLRDSREEKDQKLEDRIREVERRQDKLPSPEELKDLQAKLAAVDKREALTSQKVALYVGACGGLIALGWKVIELIAGFHH